MRQLLRYLYQLPWVLVASLFFMVLLIPNSDISDYLTDQLAKSGVYAQFDELNFNLLPYPSVDMVDMTIETQGLPPLRASTVTAAPILSQLVMFRPGFTVGATELFKGDIELSWSAGNIAKSNQPFQNVDLQASGLSLEAAFEFLRRANLFAVRAEGKLNLRGAIAIDPGFVDQPNATAMIEIPNFVLPSQSIMVNMNGVPVPVQMPGIDLGKLSIKGAKLADGRLDLDEITIGNGRSDISGKAKGTIGLLIRRDTPQAPPRTELNSIDLSMDLTVARDFMDRNQKSALGMGLSMIPVTLRQESPKGTRLSFRMKVDRPGQMPTFSALSEKL